MIAASRLEPGDAPRPCSSRPGHAGARRGPGPLARTKPRPRSAIPIYRLTARTALASPPCILSESSWGLLMISGVCRSSGWSWWDL